MNTPVTKVYVSFQGIAKGKRKCLTHKLELSEMPGHEALTPDQMNALERIAWAKIDELEYRGVSKTAQLFTCLAQYDAATDIIMVRLFPNRQQIIMRNL